MITKVPLADGISAFVDRYDAVIIDLWGVIHDGIELYPGVADCLQRLVDIEKPYALLSNAPRRAVALARSMGEMGLSESLYPYIMSSGEATWLALKERREDWFKGVGDRCLHIGPERDANLFDDTSLEPVKSVFDADFILNTGPWDFGETVADYEDRLVAGVERGLNMICANPDLEVIRGGKRIICAGALAKRYKQLGGIVIYYGKPYPPIYETCLRQIGNPHPANVLAIGDSLHTDIAGAARMGMDSILVVGGIHSEALSADGSTNKSSIEAKIAQACAKIGHFPIAAIAEFSW